MGYAGNAEPSYIIPSTIAVGGADSNTVRSRQGIDDLDFYIGNEVSACVRALELAPSHDDAPRRASHPLPSLPSRRWTTRRPTR